jgi:hypothetical protein
MMIAGAEASLSEGEALGCVGGVLPPIGTG